jgi:hypothetical protein
MISVQVALQPGILTPFVAEKQHQSFPETLVVQEPREAVKMNGHFFEGLV